MSEYKRELERKVKKGGAIAKMLLVRGDTLGCTDSRSVCEVARARGVEMAAASRLRGKKAREGRSEEASKRRWGRWGCADPRVSSGKSY
jgi:hypothetical protein